MNMNISRFLRHKIADVYLVALYFTVFFPISTLRRLKGTDPMNLRRSRANEETFVSLISSLDERHMPPSGRFGGLVLATRAAGKRWLRLALLPPCMLLGWERELPGQLPPTRIYTMF